MAIATVLGIRQPSPSGPTLPQDAAAALTATLHQLAERDPQETVRVARSGRMSAADEAIPLLDEMRSCCQSWQEIAPRYGVTHADPPWNTSLYATCECLAAGGALPALDRRRAEDRLSESTYHDVPAPERQLLALAHTMLSRGRLSEADLDRRMRVVRARLQSS